MIPARNAALAFMLASSLNAAAPAAAQTQNQNPALTVPEDLARGRVITDVRFEKYEDYDGTPFTHEKLLNEKSDVQDPFSRRRPPDGYDRLQTIKLHATLDTIENRFLSSLTTCHSETECISAADLFGTTDAQVIDRYLTNLDDLFRGHASKASFGIGHTRAFANAQIQQKLVDVVAGFRKEIILAFPDFRPALDPDLRASLPDNNHLVMSGSTDEVTVSMPHYGTSFFGGFWLDFYTYDQKGVYHFRHSIYPKEISEKSPEEITAAIAKEYGLEDPRNAKYLQEIKDKLTEAKRINAAKPKPQI